ncbi:glycosyl transferase, family 2 [Richelia sinica FACHB-800]|uniref:Glycosyl transferase, family 2 n=1 Tax=Richelia sinica FACHB-800 TaxID=1357546 RepID=A0A975TB07_9NOST|nr:glycosyltransferase family 2 protein [Richelia sinica]MBD2664827.1 glycosyltransferase [Richelia sinica FACHB-800]QXE25384.1 glycosyl transferase, family 2 [Richelia sinica FACHB-800]
MENLYPQVQVDVITIVKNCSDVILQTLSSVSSQTYEYINHIIIDGKSTDNTKILIDSFKHNKNVNVYEQDGHGIANAFNNGLRQSQGEIVIFLNAGDSFIDENVLSKVVDSYIKEKWLWSFGETISVSKKKLLKRYIKQYKTWSNEYLLYGNPMCHQSTFYSRHILNQIGLYNENLKLGMDYDFNIRASLTRSPFLLYFPISYYDTSGVSSIRVFRSFRTARKIRNLYFPLSITKNFLIDSISFAKAIKRFIMIPIKLLF